MTNTKTLHNRLNNEDLKMNNYKIKVNNEAESKEAQGLFFELGFTWCGNSKDIFDFDTPEYIVNWNNGYITVGDHSDENRKEITLPELHDMVVLKRNDVNDATHKNSMLSYIKLTDGWYYFDNDVKKWLKSTGGKPEYYEKLKPIEKTMKKEYIFKQISGDYKLVDHDCQGWAIEIPEGAKQATLCGTFIAFWKDGAAFFVGSDTDWDYGYELDCSSYLDITKDDGAKIIWQRPSQPEELPFIDDEQQSLNDQHAEIEQVCQEEIHGTVESKHSHYFIDVSDVNEVDFYEIALRYNVTDPCIQHILKKCLAVGNRGHKDFIHDLQDIFDTAARALAIHNR